MNDTTIDDSQPDDVAAGDPGTPAPEKRSNYGRIVAWLVLLVFVGATSILGYRYLEQAFRAEQPDPNGELIASLSASLEATRESVDALDARVGELAGLAAGTDSRFRDIEQQFAGRLEQLDSLPGRIANLEESMASLRGISSGLRDAWLLAEAEYYMQIANAQLQLAGNPQLAMLALQLADEKILQLANPALTDIRRALADEIRALDTVERPDIEGIALQLASLATTVDELPLNEEIDVPQEPPLDAGETPDGMDRFFASLKKTATDVVSVRRSDDKVRPLIAPEAQYFLRANLALQFQAARIALLRGEQALYDQSLDDAATWLSQYYDTDSAAVRSALQAVSDARQSVLPVNLPDISASLRLLREYRVRSSTTSAPATAGDGDNP
jgi:uroporphyrin-III C-methyltransferase